METLNLPALAAELLTAARGHASGRSARAIHAGAEHTLRQVVVALAAEHGMAEHESPGEATLQVLAGRVRLTAGDDVWEGGTGDHVVIPGVRHDLMALEDAVVLLTVALGTRA